MPPFSNKKKKLQLQLKRQQKRERDDDPNAFYRTIMQKTHFRGKPIGQKNQKETGGRGGGADPGKGNRERFADLQFFKDTDEEIKERKEKAMLPIVPLEEIQLEIDAMSPASQLDMPKRPPWNKSFTREQLDRQEQIYFKQFVDNLLEQSATSDKKLSYFDLNLDTWRQLWRVLEMSEIITIIVDIRHPLFHFPPALYNHIVNDLKKMVVIVVNKIDLVPASLVIAWQAYLKSQYPEAHIVPFASYAGMKQKTNGKRVGNMKMAADGARRFMLMIEKMVRPGAIDFTSWKEKIQKDAHVNFSDDEEDSDDEQSGEEEQKNVDSDEDDVDKTENNRRGKVQRQVSDDDDDDNDDDDDEDTNFGAKALKKAQQIKQKNDTAYYQAEKYKDGILTIGCVGHPNVGKSSFMNALIGKKVVSVSRTPGHTKHFQTIFLTPNIRLCDCPGLVFPSYYPKQLQVLMGCYPISQLREPYSSIQYLAERVDMVEKLKLKPADEIRHEKPAVNDHNYAPVKTVGSKRVGVTSDWSAWSICESWAMHRGFLTARSGRPDVYRAANHLLRMALDGRTLCMSFYPPDYLSQQKSNWEQHEDIERIERIQGRHNIVQDDDDGY
uniref:Guanine nucleotide-binding protein-like 1 n=1 Tax=Aceria tosichella TaxID=561515 RepID=A0A6G1S8V5_9ACAR